MDSIENENNKINKKQECARLVTIHKKCTYKEPKTKDNETIISEEYYSFKRQQ